MVLLVGFAVMQNLAMNRGMRTGTDAIASLEADIKEIRLEKIRLEAEVTELAESVKALDDTTRAARMGQAMREGQGLAKQLSVLDGQEVRAKRAVESQREALGHMRRRMIWMNALFLGAAATVTLTLAALRRIG